MADLAVRSAESSAFLSFAFENFGSDQPSAYNSKLTARCQRCLLNSAATALADGLCPPCHTAGSETRGNPDSESRREELLQSLDETIERSCGTGRHGFDALLMYSGGKDSAYLLDELRRRYPRLRITALMIENGFASEAALENIRYTFGKVDVTHSVLTPHFSLYHSLFRHCLANFGTRGGYETVDRSDGDLLFDIAKNVAAASGIPLIIAGLSRAQCEDILGLDSHEVPETTVREKRLDIAGFPLTDIYERPDYRYWWDGSEPPGDFVPRVLFPFFVWDYDEQKVRDTVAERKLLPESQVDPIVTNHKLIPVILALDYLRLGYCTFEPEFSKLIRRGLAARSTWLPIFQALEYLAPRGEFMPRSITAALGQLGFSPGDLMMPIAPGRIGRN